MDINTIVKSIEQFVTTSPWVLVLVQIVKVLWKERPPNSSKWIALVIGVGAGCWMAYTTPVLPTIEVYVHWLYYILGGTLASATIAMLMFDGAQLLVKKANQETIYEDKD